MLGPAGYGLPLVPAEQVGERELALMVLVRADEPEARVGIGGMRAIMRALIAAGLPLVFGPGAIHLPTIPAYRKWNRIDLGTADKVASAALCIADQSRRLGVDFADTSFVMLELGGAFSAALAVDGGRIVDGIGGSAGPIGARACGALDAEVAYLLGGCAVEAHRVQRRRARPAGRARSLGAGALRATREGWLALEEGAAKAALALTSQRAGPARDPRRGAPGAGAGHARSARHAARPRGAGADGRPGLAARRARRCWPTVWRAGATRRSSSAWACATRAAPRSTTSGSTAPTGSGCANDSFGGGDAGRSWPDPPRGNEATINQPAASSHSRIDV